MIKVSTTGMVVSLITDLRFPIPGQQGHGSRIIQYIYRKRIPRILIVLLLSSTLYFAWGCVVDGAELSLKSFFIKVYSGTVSQHLWYLYAYVGFLMCVPMLRAMVNHMETKHFYYMFGIILFYQSILPTIEYLANGFQYTLNSFISIEWITVSIVCYPCLGYFLEYRVELVKSKKNLFMAWGVNLILIAVSCFMTFREVILTGECNESVSQKFHSYFVIVNCATIYLTIKYICQYKTFPRIIEKGIISMGNCCFGIYIVHLIIKYLDAKMGIYNWMISIGIEDLPAALIFTLIVFMISYGLTFVVRNLPGMRKLI